jgi:hypothetical protein
MNFKEATDELFERVNHEDLARALEVSVAAIRQARLRAGAAARRPPPKDWRCAVIRLAEQRASRYLQLSAQLRGSSTETRSDECGRTQKITDIAVG